MIFNLKLFCHFWKDLKQCARVPQREMTEKPLSKWLEPPAKLRDNLKQHAVTRWVINSLPRRFHNYLPSCLHLDYKVSLFMKWRRTAPRQHFTLWLCCVHNLYLTYLSVISENSLVAPSCLSQLFKDSNPRLSNEAVGYTINVHYINSNSGKVNCRCSVVPSCQELSWLSDLLRDFLWQRDDW